MLSSRTHFLFWKDSVVERCDLLNDTIIFISVYEKQQYYRLIFEKKHRHICFQNSLERLMNFLQFDVK